MQLTQDLYQFDLFDATLCFFCKNDVFTQFHKSHKHLRVSAISNYIDSYIQRDDSADVDMRLSSSGYWVTNRTTSQKRVAQILVSPNTSIGGCAQEPCKRTSLSNAFS